MRKRPPLLRWVVYNYGTIKLLSIYARLFLLNTALFAIYFCSFTIFVYSRLCCAALRLITKAEDRVADGLLRQPLHCINYVSCVCCILFLRTLR